MVADDGEVSATTDYVFPETGRLTYQDARKQSMYNNLVEALRQSSPHCQYAIQMLELARKDALYDYKGLHPELEQALKAWRRTKAAEMGRPAFYILHQRVLLGIADTAPTSEEALLAVPGFGPGLFSRYGEEILDIVIKH